MSNYTHLTNKLKIAAMMLLILLAAITFAIHSQPVQPVKVVKPDLIIMPAAMRRESEPSRSILVNLPNGRTLVWEVA